MGMTFNESTAVITRIGNAQAELLDHSGHVNRGLGRHERGRTLVWELARMAECSDPDTDSSPGG
jgi:hypothetical protein